MKIATWNVNSLRTRLGQVLAWVDREQPHILALQETKLQDKDFPTEAIQEAGYQVLYSGQKAYNGVAILSTLEAHDVITDLPGLSDPQRRVLGATYAGLRIFDLYVPNGGSLDSEKYVYKLRWLDKLMTYLEQQLAQYPQMVVLGDFNIAPEDRDVYDPQAWEGSILVSEPERAAFHRLLELGFVDTFRLFPQEAASFSWWDYRAAAFRRNMGLRIDHIFVSHALRQACIGCRIDKGPRRLPRPSDHAPVIAELVY